MPLLDHETTETARQITISVPTTSATEDALTSSQHVETTALSHEDLDRMKLAFRDGWDRILNESLIEWGGDPSRLRDSDIEPPSRELITLVSRYALKLRDAGLPPPTRVVPNGDGGIALEKFVNSSFQSIEFEKDGTVELLTFKDGKLESRHQLSKAI